MSTSEIITTRTVPPLSQSRQALMACPYLYRERIVMGHREPPNQYSERGIHIHRVLQKYAQHLVATRQPSDYAFFDNLLVDESGEALEILEGLRETLIFDPEQILAAEAYLALDEDLSPLELEEGREVMLTPPAFEGTPDLLLMPDPRTIEIVDYKSYFQIVDADTFQAQLYPLMVFKHYPGVQRVIFRLMFVRYGDVTRTVEYTREADLERLEKRARSERRRQLAMGRGRHLDNGERCRDCETLLDTFHADDAAMRERYLRGEHVCPVPAMPGAHCAYCPKLTLGCPLSELNPYAEMSATERVKLGIWLAAAHKFNTQILKDMVNGGLDCAYQDENGNKYQAGFELQMRASYPLTAYSMIAANDPELLSKLSISGLSSPLKAKKRIVLKGILDGVKTERAQTRFKISGVEEDED